MAKEAVDYEMHFGYRMRLRPHSKGKTRPEVLTLDWNCQPDVWGSEFRDIIVVGISDRTRIFAKTVTGVCDINWKMMYNKVHLQGSETRVVKWNPDDGTVLAAGSNGNAGVAIQLLKWENEKVVKAKDFQVPCSGTISGLSWNGVRNYLLATIDPQDDGVYGTMAIIRHPGETNVVLKVIATGYKGAFCGVLHPDASFILSTSVNSNIISIWSEGESDSFNWRIVKNIECTKGIKKVCFSRNGIQFVAAGKGLQIWDWTFKGEALLPELELRKRTQHSDGVTARTRGVSVTLKQHCDNLISLDLSTDGSFVLTGSSKGSICLHGDRRQELDGTVHPRFKAVCFQWDYVQHYHPEGNITCVAYNPNRAIVAHGGTDGLVILWQCYEGAREVSDRNPDLDKLCYLPEWTEDPDTSKDMSEDAKSVLSINTELSDHSMEQSLPSAEGQILGNPRQTLSEEIIRQAEEFKMKQKELEEKLGQLQGDLNTSLQCVRKSMNSQNELLEVIVQHASKM